MIGLADLVGDATVVAGSELVGAALEVAGDEDTGAGSDPPELPPDTNAATLGPTWGHDVGWDQIFPNNPWSL